MKDLQTALGEIRRPVETIDKRPHVRTQSESFVWRKEVTKPTMMAASSTPRHQRTQSVNMMTIRQDPSQELRNLSSSTPGHQRSQSVNMMNIHREPSQELRDTPPPLSAPIDFQPFSGAEVVNDHRGRVMIAPKESEGVMPSTSSEGDLYYQAIEEARSMDEMTVSTQATRYFSSKARCLYPIFPTKKELARIGAKLFSRTSADIQASASSIDDMSSAASQYMTFKGKCLGQKMPNGEDIVAYAACITEQIPSQKEIVGYAAAVSDQLPDKEEITGFATSMHDVFSEGFAECSGVNDDMRNEEETVTRSRQEHEQDREVFDFSNHDDKEVESCATTSIVIDLDASESAEVEEEFVVNAIALKEWADDELGISFSRASRFSPLIISKIDEKSIFAKSKLLPGMAVLSINGKTSMAYSSPADVIKFLKVAPTGLVRVKAMGCVCTLQLLEKGSKLGLELTERGFNVHVKKIKSKSRFWDTDLREGLAIISINGKPCPTSAKEAKNKMKQSIGDISIVAIDMDRFPKQSTNIDYAAANKEFSGIDYSPRKVKKAHSVRVRVNEVSPSDTKSVGSSHHSRLAGLMFVDSESTREEEPSSSIFKGKVTKESMNQKMGISFARADPNSPLYIESIDSDGLFGKTELKPGMVLLTINGRNMMWKCPRVAADILAASTKISIKAEAFVAKAQKLSKADKVGMTLEKSACGRHIRISEIFAGGKFESSDLRAGMVVLYINDLPCPKTIKELTSLTRSATNEIKIMAVNLDRQWDIYNRHQKQLSKEVIDKLNMLANGKEAEKDGILLKNSSAETVFVNLPSFEGARRDE